MSRGLYDIRKDCEHDNHSYGEWKVMPYYSNCGPTEIFEEEGYYVKYYRECSKCGHEQTHFEEVSGYEEQQQKIEDFKKKSPVKQLKKTK